MDRKLKGCLHNACVMGHVIKLLIYEPLTCHSGKSSHPARSHILFLSLLVAKVKSILSPAPGHLFQFLLFFEPEWNSYDIFGREWSHPNTHRCFLMTVYFIVFPLFVKKKKDLCLNTNTHSTNTEWIPRWNMYMSCVCAEPAIKAFYKHNSTYLGVICFFFWQTWSFTLIKVYTWWKHIKKRVVMTEGNETGLVTV